MENDLIKCEIKNINGVAVVSSKAIAEYFEKEHKDVLEKIRTMECSDEFRQRNYTQSFYKNEQNKKQPEYLMNRDGFVFLVMGFTGKKASGIKELYIKAFNEMESFINSRFDVKGTFKPMTDIINISHDPVKFYHFTNEINMIYRIVLGIDAKNYKLNNNISEEDSLRDNLTKDELKSIDHLQMVNTGLIEVGMDYATRKDKLSEIYNKRKIKQIS